MVMFPLSRGLKRQSLAFPRLRVGFALDPRYQVFLIQCILFLSIAWVVIDIKYGAAAPTDNLGANAQEIAEYAEGSPAKKVVVLGLFVACVLLVGVRRLFASISIPYILALFWLLLSVLWAIAPGISFRRWTSLAFTLITVTSCVGVLGARGTLRVVYFFLASLTVSSFGAVALAYAKIPLFAFAVHPPNEMDVTLVGDWRGLMPHKNIAGAVFTHASVVFMYFAINRRKYKDIALFLGSVLFVVGTKSKTSIALDFFVLIFSLVYWYSITDRLRRQVFIVGIYFALIAGAVVAFMLEDQIVAFLWNRASVSGRGAIWMSLVNYLRDNHWLLGAGYGSFWAIGDASPIYKYAEGAAVLHIGHAHNGYLESFIAGGVVGFILTIIALVILPFYHFCTADRKDARVYAMCFGLWSFGILQNFTESQIFAPDRQSWLFFLIGMTLVAHLDALKVRAVKEQVRMRYIAKISDRMPRERI